MGKHDDYGKRVLSEATRGVALIYGQTVEVHYGTSHPAQIDGTFGDVAIEIESRVSKQVRGAVLDLICHPYPKKLLILLPVHMEAKTTAAQCSHIMTRFCPEDSFRVVVLQGSGDNDHLAEDVATVATALIELGASISGEETNEPSRRDSAVPAGTSRPAIL